MSAQLNQHNRRCLDESCASSGLVWSAHENDTTGVTSEIRIRDIAMYQLRTACSSAKHTITDALLRQYPHGSLTCRCGKNAGNCARSIFPTMIRIASIAATRPRGLQRVAENLILNDSLANSLSVSAHSLTSTGSWVRRSHGARMLLSRIYCPPTVRREPGCFSQRVRRQGHQSRRSCCI